MVIGDDGAAHRRPVTLGIEDGEDVQVTTGLAKTDTVVTGGAYGLEDGTKVKVGAASEDDKPGADAESKKPAAGKGGDEK